MTFHSLLATPAVAQGKQEEPVADESWMAFRPPAEAQRPACIYDCSSLERKSAQKLLAAVPDEDQEEHEDNAYDLLKAEIAGLRFELSKISLGQSALTSVVNKIHDHFVALPEENIIPAHFAERVVEPAAEDNHDSQSFAGAPTEIGHNNTGMRRNKAKHRKDASSKMLESMIDVNTKVQAKKLMEAVEAQKATCLGRLLILSKENRDMLMESASAIIIMGNMIFLGICSDHWDGSLSSIFFAFDVIFVVIFGIELFSRWYMHGFANFFCGSSGASNMLDTFLVAVDTLQLLLVFEQKTDKQLQAIGVPPASLFRTLRLVRLTRVLRLFRHPLFKDMIKMMVGTMTGVRTLGGAFLMFTVMVYCIALFCTEVFGQDTSSTDVYPYFRNVPRSVYTVLRCSFGDCSTSGGTPIPEFLQESYGFWGSVLYTLFIFFMTVGFFNVVAATFVDGIVSEAVEEQKAKLHMRLADEQLLATNVCSLVKLFLQDAGFVIGERDDHDLKTAIHTMELPRFVISNVCQTEEAIQALDALDIDPDDHGKLADILDPDHSGTVGFTELVNGLRSLRGHPRRSDVVMIDLMVRDIQRNLDDVLSILMENRSA